MNREPKERFTALCSKDGGTAANTLESVTKLTDRKVVAIWLFEKIPKAGKYCPEHLSSHISKPHMQ